jgi:predicted P-loop ATPase
MYKLNKSKTPDGEHKLKHVMQQLDQFFSARYDYHFNVLTECAEIRKKGVEKGEDFVPLHQRYLNGLSIEALYADIDCLDRDVYRYFHSSLIEEYHPLVHYINHLPKWDKRDRVSPLAKHISKNQSWAHLFHCWLLGMVKQWITPHPIHGNALMPILISQAQGLKKSTFCRLLLPEELRRYYTDEFDLNSRTSAAVKLSKYALINIDEFNRMGDVKSAKLKNILQMADVNCKRCGSSEYEQRQRIASFIGTANFREILSDPTGSRRFIPIELPQRITNLRINHKQLYAQLKHEIDQGKCHWLRPDEERRLIANNMAYTKRPIEEPVFNTCFAVPAEEEQGDSIKRLSISQIYDTLRKHSSSTMREISLNTFGSHLAMMGVKKYRTSVGYLYRVKKLL